MRDAFPPPMRVQLYSFAYGNAAVRTFERAHSPYGFVWVDCAWAIGFVGVDYAWTVGDVWVGCVWVVLSVCWENGAHESTPSVLYF